MSATSTQESAADRVYGWVRARILDGTFPSGRLLSEGEVSEALAVSRTPVREAFLQLAAEDMLQLYPKRGALVVSVTVAELMEVVVARSLIEPWAAKALAARADREPVIAALRVVLDESRVAAAKHDHLRFHETDRSFHQTIIAAAGNQLLADFYSSLRDRQLRGAIAAMHSAQDRAAEITEQHAEIIAALEAGDGERASALLVEHLEGTARLLGPALA